MRSCWPGLANWPVLYTSIHSLVMGPTLYTPLHSVGASTKPLVLASTLWLCGPYACDAGAVRARVPYRILVDVCTAARVDYCHVLVRVPEHLSMVSGNMHKYKLSRIQNMPLVAW